MKLISLNPNCLIPWSGITITPDLKALIGIGRKGIFIHEWPYEGVAFEDHGIMILENSVIQDKNLAPGVPVGERSEGS